jgi:hypothetical protein
MIYKKRAAKQPPSTNTKTKLDLIDSRDFHKPPLSGANLLIFILSANNFPFFLTLYRFKGQFSQFLQLNSGREW